MANVFMPKMGDAMEEGTLLKWLKNEGDEIAQGDPIAEIETDKVNLEIESDEAGIVRKLLVAEGDTVPIGQAIAIVGGADEDIEVPAASEPEAASAEAEQPAEQPAEQEDAVVAAAAAQPAQNAAQVDQVVDRAPGERVRASPLVRRLATEHGINLNGVQGSGPGGRIVKTDIMPLIGRPNGTGAEIPAATTEAPAKEAEQQPAAEERAPAAASAAHGEFEMRDLSRIRKTIARRMSESFQQAPHFFVTVSIDMGPALALREQVIPQVEDAQKFTVNDLIVKASALALRSFPMLNASFAGDQVRINKRIDVGFAIALPTGLISPFIPDADNKSVGAIAAMTKDLIKRAREGGLMPDEYQGGTFTISNMGMMGVDEFTAIINPPQAAILAVGAIKKTPVWEDGEFKPVDLMKVTMSADHRVTDGAEVARYLAEMRRLLESPMLLLVS